MNETDLEQMLAGLAPMPVWNEQPHQSAPKKKAQERAKAAAGA